eukprot:355450_1
MDDEMKRLESIYPKLETVSTNFRKHGKKKKEIQVNYLHSGFLEKQSVHLKKFRKRWITLTYDGYLYCYKTADKKDEKETEKIDLTQFSIVRKCSGNKQVDRSKHMFEIVSVNSKTKRLFIANNSDEMKIWIKLIQHTIKKEILKIPIVMSGYTDDKYIIHSIYSKQTKMDDIFAEIKDYINTKFQPLRVKITRVSGFIGKELKTQISELQMNQISDTCITDYVRSKILNVGLAVTIEINYVQKILSEALTCEHMSKLNTTNPLHCPIYYAMKEDHQFDNDYLNHLCQYTHFKDEYTEKPVCKHKDKCKTYIRLQNSDSGNYSICDQCHMKLFLHPPRSRNIKLAQNFQSLILNKSEKENHPLYTPKAVDYSSDGYLSELIAEVIDNGYKYDLCLDCGMYDECKHDNYSIVKIIDEKMNHKRHKAVGSPLRKDHMLALILYTSCECNYDLCKSQRNGDYNKWKVFDYCLWNAILLLS